MALPEVEETTHFRLPSFKVRGRPFVGMEKGDTTVIVAVAQAEAQAAAAEDAEVYQEVWRAGGPHGRIFVGLRVDLGGGVSAERLRELTELTWRHKAPKRLVTAYDEHGESHTGPE
ncbi:MmcQ/YjbR family DNA-binding protein [Streptomyces sp. 7N604]|uniref:MmcQ/YjbR family DNA-binding protein n=1 Tax=Streptomyces sp. 7N604 TaxID=3457415 RepID=UPI003FD4715A